MLCEVVVCIKKELCLLDVLGCFGGEEFVVLFIYVMCDDVVCIVECICVGICSCGVMIEGLCDLLCISVFIGVVLLLLFDCSCFVVEVK